MINPSDVGESVAQYLEKVFSSGYYQHPIILGIQNFAVEAESGLVLEEYDYPVIRQPVRGKGRQHQADCIMHQDNGIISQKKVSGNILGFYEIKCVLGSISFKGYLYDIVKLAAIKLQNPFPRYFVVSGLTDIYESRFLNSRILHEHRRDKVIDKLLPMSLGVQNRVNLLDCHPKAEEYIAEFRTKLGDSVPDIALTEMVADCSTPHIRVGIWEVTNV